jgi:hypothetical protein
MSKIDYSTDAAALAYIEATNQQDAARRAPSATPAPTPAATPASVAGLSELPPRSAAPVNAPSSHQAEIDKMVGALKENGASLSNPIDRRAHASMSFTAGDPTAEVQVLSPAAPGLENQELYDDGIDLQGNIDRQAAEVKGLQARLDDAKYDPVTGKPNYTVTGDARTRLEKQLSQAKESYGYSFTRANALAAQRTQGNASAQSTEGNTTVNSRGEETTWEAEAVRMAYIDSAPPGQRQAFAERYDRELQDSRSKAILAGLRAARR